MNPNQAEPQAKAAHTPGPWIASDFGAATEATVRDEIGFIVCTVNQFAASFGDKKDEANARLIAAAPELLECLQNMAAKHFCGCLHPHCNRCADDKDNAAAIAKATKAEGAK